MKIALQGRSSHDDSEMRLRQAIVICAEPAMLDTTHPSDVQRPSLSLSLSLFSVPSWRWRIQRSRPLS